MDDVTQFLTRYGGAVLFAGIFADQLGVPLPGLPLLLAAGALAGTGALHPAVALGVAVAAAVLADLLWYEIGRRRGRRALRLVCRVSLEPDSCVGRTQEVFLRHGLRSVLFARFVPALSTVTSPLAGTLGVGRVRFLLYDGLGALLWAGGYMSLGYAFSDRLEVLAASAGHAWTVLAVAGLGAVAAYVVYKYVRRRLPAGNFTAQSRRSSRAPAGAAPPPGF